jgi:hypothetical protein
MTKGKKKEKPEMSETEEDELRKNPVNVFQCGHPDCQKLDAMVLEEFKHHAFSVHGLKSDQFKGKKQMVMHLDGSQWFSSTYKWTLDSGLEFSQFTKMARSKDDPMRFEH